MPYKFIIPVYWSVSHEFVIEASSLEAAIKIAEDSELPTGDYIDGSFEVNHECLDELNRDTLECTEVDDTPENELPLLIGTLKSDVAQKHLEDRLKGDDNVGIPKIVPRENKAR